MTTKSVTRADAVDVSLFQAPNFATGSGLGKHTDLQLGKTTINWKQRQ